MTEGPVIIPSNILAEDDGSLNRIRQYALSGHRIFNSYQAIHLLKIEDSDIIPGNILLEGWLTGDLYPIASLYFTALVCLLGGWVGGWSQINSRTQRS